MTFVSTRVNQFPYFDEVLGRPEWDQCRILDFGGNIGGFLVGAGSRVDHDRYWCLDADRGAIEQGARSHPRAHFVHYDRYTAEYNPEGTRNLPIPDELGTFDIILAFSVFTHTHQVEMLELVGQLRERLEPGGRLAFTFCDPAHDRSRNDPSLPKGTDVEKLLLHERERHPDLDIGPLVEAAARSRWCLLIDEVLHVEPEASWSNQEREGRPGESYCSFFAPRYVATLFAEGRVVDPVSPNWQYCCILAREPS